MVLQHLGKPRNGLGLREENETLLDIKFRTVQALMHERGNRKDLVRYLEQRVGQRGR